MFKAIGRIRKNDLVFKVDLKPLEVKLLSSQVMPIKVQVQRGKQNPIDSKSVRVERSMNQSDIKTVTFNDTISLSCTYFIKKGKPDDKICTIRVMRAFPGGKDVMIASQDINLSMHFGKDYETQIIKMEPTRQAQGSIIKSLTYQAIISCPDEKNRQEFDQCVQWRQSVDDSASASVGRNSQVVLSTSSSDLFRS